MDNEKLVQRTTKYTHHGLLLAAVAIVGLVGASWFDYYRDTTSITNDKVWVLPGYKHVAEVAEFEITAYDAHSAQSINVARYRDGKTALNRPAVSGYTIAVDPRVIPFDSFVFIPGVGWRVAEDVGGAIKGYRIDVLMETKGDAMKFGRQKLHALWVPPQPIPSPLVKKVVRKQTSSKKVTRSVKRKTKK